MKALRTLVLAVLLVGMLSVAAYGAGWALSSHQASAARDGQPATEPGETPSESTLPARRTVPGQELKPEFRLEAGDRSVKVRALQSRLYQLAWFPELTTGRYGSATLAAVRGFQDKRGLVATGVTDQRTWDRLVSMTKKPTHDQLFNILHPGPAILSEGDSGTEVRDLQARLVAIQWIFGDVTGSYDRETVRAVRGFQAKREIPVTGEVDQRTLDRLHAMTVQPTYEQMHNIEPKLGALDPRCKTGRALCVDKSSNSLRWVVDGEIVSTFDVRFGSEELPTREGAFTVYSKSRDHVSSLYDTSMPFAMFFSGGQAVHYSPDFAATGYNGASHGCVNVRDYDGMVQLFDQVQVGDKVIVYWS
ncbi:L,D-transpeptidase family protein [Nocardioides sp.]|uniref:L,D-transpeptidase family protein n=1 Tax=Nocardioides sp. TaxID=35761 RepID=UPI002D80C7F9|nr:L,D-transpeptidase family protein [Nocardioides sp.]HET8961385.1 L,D-transpeptidase family protein [Nocardioides sp.]